MPRYTWNRFLRVLDGDNVLEGLVTDEWTSMARADAGHYLHTIQPMNRYKEYRQFVRTPGKYPMLCGPGSGWGQYELVGRLQYRGFEQYIEKGKCFRCHEFSRCSTVLLCINSSHDHNPSSFAEYGVVAKTWNDLHVFKLAGERIRRYQRSRDEDPLVNKEPDIYFIPGRGGKIRYESQSSEMVMVKSSLYLINSKLKTQYT